MTQTWQRAERQRILLITANPIGGNDVGRQYLDTLLAAAPPGAVSELYVPSYLEESATHHRPHLGKLALRVVARVPGYQDARIRLFRKLRLEKLVTEIGNQLVSHQCNAIWIVLSTAELILAADASSRLRVPLLVSVWDDPGYLTRVLRVSASLDRTIADSFSKALGYARAVSVVSQAMARAYAKHAHVSPIVIRPPCFDIAPEPPPLRRSQTILRLVFAGSLYAKDEWNALVEALNEANWRIGTKRVLLYFIGNFPVRGARTARSIKKLGRRTSSETIRLLSRMDIGYLPYWMNDQMAQFAALAFPGKLAAYATAGLAVLNHAPSYAESSAFLKAYPFGITCSSKHPGAIRDALTNLMRIKDQPAMVAARRAAMYEALSAEAVGRAFVAFSMPRTMQEPLPAAAFSEV